MFAKLKKKIQDEDGTSPRSPSLDGDVRPTKLPSPGPGVASPMKLEMPGTFSTPKTTRDFETMSMSSEISDVKDTASKEDMLKKIFKKNDQIKKLETKITELAAMIKERNKNIEKLEKSLEKQAEENKQKLEDLSSQLEAEKAKLETDSVEQLKSRVNHLEQENQSLQGRVSKADTFRQKLLKEEEEKDEMVGLNAQEMAKIKHMLLNTQADLQQCKEELSDKSTRLVDSDKQVKQLENEVQSLMSQITSITTHSENLEEDSKNHKSTRDKLQSVQKELSVKTEDLRATRDSLDKVQHNLDVLQNNSGVHQSKMTKLVEEKDEHISHLRERVQTLEQRLADGELSGDERLQAIEKERSSLEQKLSEAREQLSQVKSTWSDKISHLENQISHLNRKISEDNEELLSNRKEVEEIKDRFHKQIEELESRLEASEKQCKQHQDAVETRNILMEKLKKEHSSELLREKLHWTSLETELREKITDLHKDIDSLQRTREHEKQTAQAKITKLESSQEEFLEKEIDAEKRITSLEDSLQEMKVKLQEKDRQIGEGGEKDHVIDKLKQKMKETEEKSEVHLTRISELEKEVDDLDKECRSCGEEKDSLLLRNAQLSQDFESFKRGVKERQSDLETELQQKNHSIAGLEQVLQDMQTEAEHNKDKIRELESQQMVAITEIESEEIKKLQKQVQEGEEHLLDRNRTIKKLQQRMADLKKTLQRELNVQALPNDEITPVQQHKDSALKHASVSATNGLHLPNVHGSTSQQNPYQNNSYDSVDTIGSLPVTSSMTVNVDNKRRFYEGASDFSASDLENLILPTTHKNNSSSKTKHIYSYGGVQYDRDINFEYLKHVIMKFILSRETESVHLVKAVAVLLDLSQDEQKLMKETLEYKMSWFGTKPSLGQGQYSKFIPPAL